MTKAKLVKCEIISEIGQNHNGDMGLAREMIYASSEAGANVAKFQLFDAPKLFPSTKPYFEYNCKTQLSRDNAIVLKETCDQAKIEFMCSAFDTERVHWLQEMDVKRFKVASRSIYDAELIELIASTGKPYLVSLGMWGEDKFPELPGSNGLFLYCVSKYPTPLGDIAFSEIDFNRDYAGFSDHTLGITAAQVAISRGALIIEKHFTLDKNMYGPDHACSMTAKELEQLCSFRDEVSKCL